MSDEYRQTTYSKHAKEAQLSREAGKKYWAKVDDVNTQFDNSVYERCALLDRQARNIEMFINIVNVMTRCSHCQHHARDNLHHVQNLHSHLERAVQMAASCAPVLELSDEMPEEYMNKSQQPNSPTNSSTSSGSGGKTENERKQDAILSARKTRAFIIGARSNKEYFNKELSDGLAFFEKSHEILHTIVMTFYEVIDQACDMHCSCDPVFQHYVALFREYNP